MRQWRRDRALVSGDLATITCESCKQAIRSAAHPVKRDTRYRRSHITKWPEHDAARRALQAAVKNGVIVRGKCERCPSTKTQAHHDDYAKPLDVRWLCRDHHYEVHRELRAAGRDPDFSTTSPPDGSSSREPSRS